MSQSWFVGMKGERAWEMRWLIELKNKSEVWQRSDLPTNYAVPTSTQGDLTSGFGMRPGVTLPLWSPTSIV